MILLNYILLFLSTIVLILLFKSISSTGKEAREQYKEAKKRNETNIAQYYQKEYEADRNNN